MNTRQLQHRIWRPRYHCDLPVLNLCWGCWRSGQHAAPCTRAASSFQSYCCELTRHVSCQQV